jgi:hypothetical protein
MHTQVRVGPPVLEQMVTLFNCVAQTPQAAVVEHVAPHLMTSATHVLLGTDSDVQGITH